MTIRISLVALLCALPLCLSARDEYTRSFDKTITVSPQQKLRLEHSLGDIDISTHAENSVVIHADIRVSGSDENEAKSFADKIAILVEPSASQLSVRTRYPEGSGSTWSRRTSYSVRYEVTVPEHLAVEVRNSFGRVSVAGIKAGCDIKNSHGPLDFQDGEGSQRLENSFAPIEVSNNNGDISVNGSNGAVNIADVKGIATIHNKFGAVNISGVTRGLDVTNSNGALSVADSGGAVTINNSFGAVDAANIKGDLTVRNQNGKIEANNVSGSASLISSFAVVRFSNIGGPVAVNTSNASVTGRNAKGDAKVSTSYGAVDLADIRGMAQVTANNGTVNLENISGNVAVHNGFGLVHAENVGGLSVQNSNGAVKASNVRGDARVETSFGPVLLDNVSGAVEVGNQNGGVDVTAGGGQGCRPINIHTSFGPIRLRLQGSPSYRVTANTSFARISSEFPMKTSLTQGGGPSEGAVSGIIGDGRCELRLNNSNGEITIGR
jgi:DUF4097 and DUF4098 domain-containing protein YvlB